MRLFSVSQTLDLGSWHVLFIWRTSLRADVGVFIFTHRTKTPRGQMIYPNHLSKVWRFQWQTWVSNFCIVMERSILLIWIQVSVETLRNCGVSCIFVFNQNVLNPKSPSRKVVRTMYSSFCFFLGTALGAEQGPWCHSVSVLGVTCVPGDVWQHPCLVRTKCLKCLPSPPLGPPHWSPKPVSSW